MVKALNVLIVDSKDRRTKVKSSVESACSRAKVVELRSPIDGVVSHDFTSGFAVVFLHKNDFGPEENGKLVIHALVQEAIESSDVVIAYTGGTGGLDTVTLRQTASDWGYFNHRKWFAVNEKIETSGYDTVGMREVAEWACSRDRSYEFLPRLLRSQESVEFQTALSLLCQGFLAQYSLINRVNHGVEIRGCADVGKALKAMGWVEDEAATVVSQTVKDLERDLDLIPAKSLPDHKFWTSSFEEGQSLREGLISELPKSQAELPENVDKLVQAISEGNVKDDNFVCVVARAYNELNQLPEAA